MAVILAIIIGVLMAWLDIFFMASVGASFKISFIVLGLAVYWAQNRPRLAMVVALSAAMAADLIAPAPWFGARIIGYGGLYVFCRFLIDSFFPINWPGAVWILTFILSLAAKFGALFNNFIIYWWGGERAASLWSLPNIISALAASLATAVTMAVVSYLFFKFNSLTRRFLLIRR